MRDYLITVYKYRNKKWEHYNSYCIRCEKTIGKNQSLRHDENCPNINTIKEFSMPVQRVIQNGKTYYKWGEHGKLYDKKEDAEKQGRAAYASGYKGKK